MGCYQYLRRYCLIMVTGVLPTLSMWYLDTRTAVISAASTPVADTGPSLFKEAQAAFKKQAYQQALDLLARAAQEGPLSVDALRLKARSELYVGKPKEALLDYEQVERVLAYDDADLLKE